MNKMLRHLNVQAKVFLVSCVRLMRGDSSLHGNGEAFADAAHHALLSNSLG
jgi:hypothetical protein